ncbi:major facilitator superfamily domain-containing protein [Mycena capillaripes]|nr:major facilitator superfamily domain-containing protein [Mycena capillaripes]
MATDVEAAASQDHSLQTAAEGDAPEKGATPAPESTILTGKKLAIIFVAMLTGPPPATALPPIASDFHSFTLQGWVATSFVLAQSGSLHLIEVALHPDFQPAVFLLFYGQVLRILAAKWVLVTAIIIFEVGSLVCGVAQNVDQLIAGRTVSGMGAAGSFVAMFQILAQVTPPRRSSKVVRSLWRGFRLLGGGAFLSINLPVGGVSLAAVTFLHKASPPLGSDPNKRSWADIMHQFIRMDFVGAALIAATVTTLVLGLQWGGNTKPWGDKAVIISFVFSAVLAVAFISWEIWLGDKAMTPTSIMHSRSMYAILLYSFLGRFSLLIFSYYIPIFYQAVRHHSATKSGIDLLPFMLAVVVTIISSGQIVGKTGYYWYFLVVAPVFLGVGSGLLYTLNTVSSSARIAGFQILCGIGIGMGMQNSLLAVQVEFKDKPRLMSQATSMGTFAQFLGGTLGLGIAEPVFASELTKFLLKYAPDAPAEIVRQSPTAIYTALPPDMIPGVVRAYTESLRIVFVLGVPVAGLGLIASAFIQNIRIVKTAPGASPAAAAGEESKTGDAVSRRWLVSEAVIRMRYTVVSVDPGSIT